MGKVHGSLARAGKVKGQTPKIDKIEKKKQPRGRCVLWFSLCSHSLSALSSKGRVWFGQWFALREL